MTQEHFSSLNASSFTHPRGIESQAHAADPGAHQAPAQTPAQAHDHAAVPAPPQAHARAAIHKEPSSASSAEHASEESFSSRLELVMGREALDRIQHACVMVLGLGGVGSNATIALARGGCGKLILLDRDTVSPSNINRQAVAFTSTIGRPKTDVMAELVLDINPRCELICQQTFLEKASCAAVLQALPRPDYVIDAIDTISQKLAIAAWCQEQNIPLISSMGGANKLHPERFCISTIEKTKSCPMCKVMRKECRKRGIKKLQVLYSTEVPKPLERSQDGAQGAQGAQRAEKGETLGTMSYIPPIMGYMLAGHVIRALSQLENPYANYQK